MHIGYWVVIYNYETCYICIYIIMKCFNIIIWDDDQLYEMFVFLVWPGSKWMSGLPCNTLFDCKWGCSRGQPFAKALLNTGNWNYVSRRLYFVDTCIMLTGWQVEFYLLWALTGRFDYVFWQLNAWEIQPIVTHWYCIIMSLNIAFYCKYYQCQLNWLLTSKSSLYMCLTL